jgi:hypothetical protein
MPNSGVKRLTSGSLNLLESSGTVKACNGIALPLLVSVMLRPHRALRYVRYVLYATYVRYVRYAKWPHCLRSVQDTSLAQG